MSLMIGGLHIELTALKCLEWYSRFAKITIKASGTLEHQPTVWPVPNACAQPHHPGSGIVQSTVTIVAWNEIVGKETGVISEFMVHRIR